MPTKCKQPIINLVDQVTMTPINSNETFDYINNFLVEIGPKLARNFKEDWNDEVVTDIDNEMDGMTISEGVLMKIILDINTSKSSAIGHVSARVLKDSFLVLVPQLLHMYHQCLRLNMFPDSWKLADIIPLHKPGDPMDENNLRPIPPLPLPGTVLEVIVHAKITTHLEKNNLLISEQSSFRKGKSTIHTFANFTDDVMLELNDNKYVIAAVDFKKTFETVNHDILLKKLLLVI